MTIPYVPSSETDPSSNPDNFERAIDDNTRLLYTESIGNPRCNIDDLEKIAEVADKHGIPFIVDNTVSAPPIFNPFDHGCDIAVYSLTKLIGGHGNSIGGAVVEKGDFDWQASGKFPEITEPDPFYHGLNFWQALCTMEGTPCAAFCTKLRTRGAHARYRRGVGPHEQLPDPAGHGNAAPPRQGQLRKRPKGRRIPGIPPTGLLGQLGRSSQPPGP